MSSIEAMVHLELERRRIPFSWRFFDGVSPQRELLMPDFHPEFTLREYNIVILVIGEFWGTLPGVLDRNSLAAVLLEADGWKVVLWQEADIRAGVAELMDRDLPVLRHPAVTGATRPNPYGRPTFMDDRRNNLQGQGLLRRSFKLSQGKSRAAGIRNLRGRFARSTGSGRIPRCCWRRRQSRWRWGRCRSTH